MGFWTRHLPVFVVILLLSETIADKEFWWMGQEGTFGQGSQGQGVQGAAASSPNYQQAGQAEQGGQGLPARLVEEPILMTECPLGTKCAVQDDCAGVVGEEASELIPCMNPATAMLGVCCPAPGGTVSNALPITQGLAGAGGQSQSQAQSQANVCPASPPGLLPLEQCQGRSSNCWSVGQPDVDCVNNAPCCFDGCANVCLGAGSVSPAQPPTPARRPASNPAPRPPQQGQQAQAQRPAAVARPQPARDPWPQNQPAAQPARPQRKPQPTRPKPQARPVQPAKDPWPQNQPARRPAAAPQARPANQGAGPRPVKPASQEPFVMCPSAMKCVPKTNCDLKGVMTDTAQNYSPEVEALRVPLIPCVNREAGNSVDVCCRDPNYKDPWPGGMMMMMGAGGAGAKAGGAQVQARPQRQGQKKTQGKKKRPSNTKKQGPAKKKGHSSSGLGACSSNADCPAGTPVCSEYGYCQCAQYVPGGPECWQMSANW